MLRTISIFLLLAALAMEHVPVLGFGQAMSSVSDMVADTDDADGSLEDLVKDDAKDPLDHAYWAFPHPSVLLAGDVKAYPHHHNAEPDPIHFEVPTPPPLC